MVCIPHCPAEDENLPKSLAWVLTSDALRAPDPNKHMTQQLRNSDPGPWFPKTWPSLREEGVREAFHRAPGATQTP